MSNRAIELKQTDHPYYCSTSNYFSNECEIVYESWKDFNSAWEVQTIDHDMNYVIRYDLYDNEDENDRKFTLYLFYMGQRKGLFQSVAVNNITEDDLDEINEYLLECWKYVNKLWVEFKDVKVGE